MRLKYLDVLKAFAIIAVVLYHSGFLPYGYLGVDLFLVINGYLITRGLSRELLCSSSFSDVCGGGYKFGSLFFLLEQRISGNPTDRYMQKGPIQTITAFVFQWKKGIWKRMQG